MFRRPIALLAGLLCYLAFIAAFLCAVDYVGARIAPGLMAARHADAAANARGNAYRKTGALLVRPLWKATLMPQLSTMDVGRIEYFDRIANVILKGNVYGTL